MEINAKEVQHELVAKGFDAWIEQTGGNCYHALRAPQSVGRRSGRRSRFLSFGKATTNLSLTLPSCGLGIEDDTWFEDISCTWVTTTKELVEAVEGFLS